MAVDDAGALLAVQQAGHVERDHCKKVSMARPLMSSWSGAIVTMARDDSTAGAPAAVGVSEHQACHERATRQRWLTTRMQAADSDDAEQQLAATASQQPGVDLTRRSCSISTNSLSRQGEHSLVTATHRSFRFLIFSSTSGKPSSWQASKVLQPQQQLCS